MTVYVFFVGEIYSVYLFSIIFLRIVIMFWKKNQIMKGGITGKCQNNT